MSRQHEEVELVPVPLGELRSKCAALWDIAQRFLPRCGDWRGDDGPDEPAMRHDCPRFATRLSIVYERAEIYVCDLDHEGFEPWDDDTIHDLPWAKAVRALPLNMSHRWLSGLSRPNDAAYHAGFYEPYDYLAYGGELFARSAMWRGWRWGCTYGEPDFLPTS